MKSITTLSMLLSVFVITSAFGQVFAETVSTLTQKENQLEKRHSLGSSLFILANLEDTDEPGDYFQLNYGYRLSKKHNFIVEAISWTYYEPLGKYEKPDNKHYPGKVKAYGVGIGYQCFFWKNAFTTVQATPFYQKFYDDEKGKTQDGFQLYLQVKAGYRIEFFENCFVEPAVSFNYWPINTNMPDSFKPMEDDAPNYFLCEPSLHFGYTF
jgi:hypothetical protein